MAKSLADQLGPDTIVRFARSAPLRLIEGDLLAEEHPLMAIYLYGYAAEMTIKAAYFTNLGYAALQPIDRDARIRAEGVARLNQFMKFEPHDVLGWARLLVWDKEVLHTPPYEGPLKRQIVSNASVVYQNWRPQMRYRNTVPAGGETRIVRKAVDWLVKTLT